MGDFNGDGKVDILWHEAGTGKNELWEMDGVNLLSEIDLKAVNPKWRLHGIGA